MTYKKPVFILFSIIILVLIGLGYYKYGKVSNTTYVGEDQSITPTPESAVITTPNNNLSLKDKAWKVLEEYLVAAKNYNLAEIKRLSYQISDVCKDPSKTKECNTRMATVYYFGSNLKKDDLKNVWSDSKQIILSSNLHREEDKDTISYNKAIVYFVVDENDQIKLLKFNDSKGVSMPKEGRAVEEIESYLKKRMTDDDQDGIEDEIESCIGQQPESCKQTDPKKRDSNGNGFWDGIDAQFYK